MFFQPIFLFHARALKFQESKLKLFTQAVRPELKFQLPFFFRVQTQIAVMSLKRMHHLRMHTAHGIYRSCLLEKLARIP